MQQLRPYQRKALAAVQSSWKQGHRAPLMVAPTGSGKTTIIAHLVRQFPSTRVLFLAPARQLVVQAHGRLIEHDVPAGIMMGRKAPRPEEPVHVATVQTAARRTLGAYDLVVIDEAHRAVSRQCVGIVKRYPQAKIVGMTATPIRLDGKPLSRVFDDLLVSVTVKELQKQGFLVPTRVYARPEGLDLSRVRWSRKNRDYATGSLGRHMSQPKLVGDAVEHWNRHARGMRTFVYCASLDHARAVKAQFANAGATEIIEGATGPTRRRELFEALSRKDIRILINVGVLTEGVDQPDLECIVLLRPTASRGLARQIQGRGLRPHPGKRDCLYLDHADIFRRHGFPEDPEDWKLHKRERVIKPKGTWKPKARKCPHCGQMIPIGAKPCPKCGQEGRPVPATADGKLVPLRVTERGAWT